MYRNKEEKPAYSPKDPQKWIINVPKEVKKADYSARAGSRG
jgi:hypothetical protein